MNRNLSDIYCLDCLIVVRKQTKANEKTFQALTLNIEQPRSWKPHTCHYLSVTHQDHHILFCFASCSAMPLGEINLHWLPWQGKWWGREYLLGFCLQVVFEELGREMSIALLDLNNWLVSFGSMFLQVWGLGFFCLFTLPLAGEQKIYQCWNKLLHM